MKDSFDSRHDRDPKNRTDNTNLKTLPAAMGPTSLNHLVKKKAIESNPNCHPLVTNYLESRLKKIQKKGKKYSKILLTFLDLKTKVT